ncbi:MAG TPA: DUF2167 domain-containing protein [Pseudomonadales bacterium]|nr:DUF2167 domain-containing protein [Pseudomonadales bacterium]
MLKLDSCWKVAFALIISLATSCLVYAQESENKLHWHAGHMQLLNLAELNLGDQYVYLDAKDAKALLTKMGNFPDDNTLALIGSKDEGQNWFVEITYDDSGYVKDDEAKEWNADELLESIKQGTDAANEERAKQGIPALNIIGWAEKPHYDAQAHKVEWSVLARSADEQPGDETVNYKTLTLGRDGYIAMNLVTSNNTLPQDRAHITTLLNNLHYFEGKRYSDFNSTTDKVAALGLTALVAGVAAKTGLLAKLLALAVAFKKFIVIGVVLAFGFIKSIFGKLFGKK